MTKRILLSALFIIAVFSTKAQYSGNALDFDGANDMVVSNSMPSFFSTPASNDFTVEAWVYPRSSAFQRIFFAQPSTSNFVSLGTSTGNVIFFYVISGGATYSVATTTSIPTNTWSHIAARWTSATSTPEVFFNGTLQPTVGGGTSSTGTDGLMVVGSRPGGFQYFNGTVDELRVWGAARTDCEILSNMNNSFTSAQTNLAVNYHFNHGTAAGTNTGVTTLSDISGNAFNGTLNNFALSGSTSNWIASGATVTASGNPLGGPLMTAVDNQTVCNNEPIAAINFTSSIPSATYSWTNDNTATGLAASGSGDIVSFTGTNNTASAISSRVIVTPSAGGCSGVADTFFIQVNPTPTIVATGDQVLCNNASTTAISFSGSTGNDYSWTNNKTSVGLAASGTGNIGAFTATNTGTTNDTATIIVTPSITSVSNIGTQVDSFAYTGSLQNFIVPAGVTSVKITAAGAQGGTATSGNYPGGKGAKMIGTFTVAPGDILDVVVGGKGVDALYSTGGGGGSGVNNGSTALIVAGGGAGIDAQDPNYSGIHAVTTNNGVDGHFNAGNGGTAGGNGGDNAYTPTNISRGGNGWNAGITGSAGANGTSTNTTFTNGTWGLGGGGGSVGSGWCNCGGGGGGYSGGGSANINSSGGGGGSYNSGTAQTNVAGTNIGNGYILIEYSSSIVCTGMPDTFMIVVKPTPAVAATSDQSVCNGDATTISFSSAVAGTTYAWTNNTTSIGLAASGNGDIALFTAVNNTSSPVSAQIIVTPTANGCPGTPDTFTITVKPTPTVNAVSNQSLCNGAATTAISFSGAVTGTTYAWINNTTSIGLAASGSGNIASFTATNTGTANVTGTITVTPTANGCPGTAITPTITVKPTPTVNAVSNQSVCDGAATTAITFGSPVTGTTYAWTNNNTSIGLAASGTGDIASFTGTNTGTTSVTGTITVTPTANGCPGTTITPTITIKPTPTVNAVSNQTLCNGAATTAISFSGAVTGTTYAWTNNTTSIGLAANGSGNIASFTAANSGTANVIGTITVTPTANGCPGTAITPTITVKPTPTVNAVSNQSVCNGAATTAITFGSPVTGTTYAWTNDNTSIGLAASGTGDIASFTGTNTGTTNVTGTITVTPTANGCPGTAITPTITIKPTPTVNSVSNQTLCNGAATTAISFSGAVTGTTYAWTNNTTSIGLAASGSGNIASFTAANSGTSNVTGTITVTPTANGCPGTAITPTITVKPSPTVNAVSNQSVCNGAATTAITFGSSVTGTTYAWTNNNTSIGLAASGSGDIASFTGTNTGTANVTGTITVTPTANGCPGPAITPIITVKPTPTVNAVSNQILCNTESTTAISFSGAVAGTTYNWTNNTTSIGLAASGSGDISSFSATNTTSAPVTATITVTPVASSCSGTARTLTILVNPTPKVNTIPDMFVCNGSASGDIVFSSATSGTTYTWTNSNTAIGLAASGTGDISSFTGMNPGTSPITATISVVPTANGCVGPAKSFIITVNPTEVPTISITSSAPANTICIHTNVTFTATVTFEGNNPIYQWKKNGIDVGTNSSVYDDNHLADGDVITCDLVSSVACPSSPVVTSNPITTNVNMYVYHTIDIFSDKPGDTLCAGEIVNFSSIITNGGSAPIYQWMKNGFNVGTNSPNYTDAAIRDRDVVTCSLTTNVLCPAASTITNSNRVMMHSMSNVTASVVIVGVYTGSSYVFHSQTTNCGNNPSYQWMLNNSPITGATHDSLWIADLKETDRIKLVVIPDRRCTNNATAGSNNLSKAQVTGVENIKVIDRLTLAPNPNNGNFMVEGEVNGLLQLKGADLVVTNAVGQVMYRSKVDVLNGRIKAELQLRSVLVSGIYHLSILSNGQRYDARFVVVGD